MLHKHMEKLLAKKKANGDELSDVEQEAKMNVIQAMHDMASGAMGSKLNGLKKVSVASDSKEGLEHGLDKAKDILSGHDMEDMRHEAEDGEHEGSDDLDGGHDEEHNMGHEAESDDESPAEAEEDGSEEMPHADSEDLDEDEINKRLEHLMALKKNKKHK